MVDWRRRARHVRESFGVLQRAGRRHAEELARLSAARQEAEYLHHVHDELAKLKPETGEEEALAERRGAMMQAEKVVGDLRDAHETLAGDGSPVPTLSAMMRRLERRAAQAPDLVEPSIKALDAALLALDQALLTVEGALRDADFDPRELEVVEERLFALRAAARKHGVSADDLPGLLDRFAGQIAALDRGEAEVAALEAAAQAARETYQAAAVALSLGRQKAAATLDAAVNGELPPLKLERARFSTQVDTNEAPDAGGPDGIDRVEFWVSTNPGTRPGPLAKIASGGELSRFMLALKVTLADRGSAPTLVFDEIDTGVGGAVADAIGSRLARLSERVQVLAVTHAPQVAARSRSHLRISKTALNGGERMATRVTLLEAGPRQEEIARMLAGATVTEEARAAARRLIETAS